MLRKVKEEHDRTHAHYAIEEKMENKLTKSLNDDEKSKIKEKETAQPNTAKSEKEDISEAQRKAILDVKISQKNVKEFEEGSVILEAIKDGEVDIFAEIIIRFI